MSAPEDRKALREYRKLVRQAVADYIGSEGCDCCRGSDHDEHKAALAKLLLVPQYDDSSGYNFPAFRSKK